MKRPNPGDVFEIVVVRWDAHWEFDCPVVILSPVKRYSPNGTSSEEMAETLADDLCLLADGEELHDEDCAKEFEWRGWTWEKIARKPGAETFRFEFFADEDGNLAYRNADDEPPTEDK